MTTEDELLSKITAASEELTALTKQVLAKQAELMDLQRQLGTKYLGYAIGNWNYEEAIRDNYLGSILERQHPS